MESIGNKIATGVVYNTLSRIVIIIVQGVTSIILARILNTADYGIMAFAAVFLSFLSQFSDFGFSSALIQKKVINQSILNTAFTMRNIIACILVFVAVIISFIVPHFYNYPHIDWVIRLLAINFIINSIGFISVALLKREMNFQSTNVATLISIVIGSVVSVTLAYMGYGFWCIVWSNVITSGAYVIAIRRLRPCKLHYEFNTVEAHAMWRFGSYIFVSGLMIYTLYNSANFLVGAVLGVDSLGHFSLALDWGTKVPTLLSITVLSVLFPAYSKIRDDKEKLEKTYLDSLHYVAFFSILVNVTFLCISEDFLRMVLGGGTDKWMPALTSFRILCVYGIVRAVLEPIGNVIVALGDSRVLFKANVIAAVIQLVFLYPVLKLYNIEGVALLVLLSYATQYIVYLPFLNNRLKISTTNVVKSILLPLICSVTFILIFLIFMKINITFSLFLTIIKAIIYASIYTITFCVATKWRLAKDLLKLLKK